MSLVFRLPSAPATLFGSSLSNFFTHADLFFQRININFHFVFVAREMRIATTEITDLRAKTECGYKWKYF